MNPLRSVWPLLAEWLDRRLPLAGLRTGGFPVEDQLEEQDFVVRAELPGLNPGTDLSVTARDGVLDIRAVRHTESRRYGCRGPRRHSEFRYGTLRRTISLPEGADPERVRTVYHDGILEVAVPLRAVAARDRWVS